MRPILLILLCLISSNCSQNYRRVNSISFNCPLRSDIFYINGVLTSLTSAKNSIREIEEESGKSVGLVYNYTYGVTKDFIQAARQKIKESALNESAFNSMLNSARIDAIKHDISIYSKEEIEELEKAYNLVKTSNLAIIAHSQGNLFANKMCKDLGPEVVSVAQVANPSSIKTSCEKKLISFDNDPVIVLLGNMPELSSMKPRTPQHHFKKGKSLLESISELISAYKSEMSEPLQALFYNHEFESYLVREPTSRRDILNFISKEWSKNRSDVAVSIRIEGEAPYKYETTMSEDVFYSFQPVSCESLASGEMFKIYPKRLDSFNFDGRMLVKNGKSIVELSKWNDLFFSAIIEPKENSRGSFVLRSVSPIEAMWR